MDNDTVSRLFAAAVSEIRPAMSFPQAMSTVAAAGLPYLGKANDWSAFQGDVLRKFQLLAPPAQMVALRIVASRVAAAPAVRLLFAEHGYEFLAGTFVPVAELDAREAKFLPATSASELSLATKRLVDGDDSGAITKACGAVDLMTADLYVRYGLGDPAHTAFAAKVMTAANRLQIFENLESDITSLGLKPADAGEIATELRQSTNHAAQALQVLRRSMGDVHGTKPALRRAAYDAVKWASAICGLFEGQ